MTSPHHPLSPQVQTLMNRGVTITQPLTVEIGEDVALDRIATTGVELRGAVRIEGSATSIGPHCRLGTEGPVVLVDCQLGSRVELGGGYFTSAVIHEGVRITNGAHVREACLLEEKVKIAHSVGLKHTVLFPYVTLGSLINFCDCLMAGGTGEKNHSEVGSSFIHFNFTPNQDKATASLLGDVPHGVMVDQPPIFLGGQGGIVGPLRLGYGTVTKAGAIIRRDYPDGGCIVGQGQERGEVAPFYPGLYLDVTRRVGNNIFYLANILALRMWYQFIRQPFMQGAPWSEALSAGAMKVLSLIIHERRRRVKELMEKWIRPSVSLTRSYPANDGSNLSPKVTPGKPSGPLLTASSRLGSKRNWAERCGSDSCPTSLN